MRPLAIALMLFFTLQPVTTFSAEPAGPYVAEPLAKRSEATGSTLFSTLPAGETGIKAFNAYDDPAMWGRYYREFSLGAIGTGVAIGDYDGDSRPDVFVVSKTGANHLFRNLGGFKFEDATERAGVAGPLGAWKQGAAFADVNNDGWLDLYVCRMGAPNLLYINQGDGTFREEAAARGLALSDASDVGSFCDYDRDGWLDVSVPTNLLDGERRPNGQRDRLFHNNGDGTFTDVTEAAGMRGDTQCHATIWWDFDEDGWPDLYVNNDFRDPDQLYRNNRDGTFTNVLSWVVPRTSHSSMGADLGDIDNDGHIDLLVADMATTTRYKDHRSMAKLRAGLVEDVQRPEAAPQYMRNTLFLNAGAGVMREAAVLTGLDATDWTWSVRLEDLDNDGLLDAYFTNGMIRELHGTDVTARMMTKESMGERIRIIKASAPMTERHLAYRNTGDLRFKNVSAAWGLDHLGLGSGAAFGDLDGDGDLDLVFASIDGEVTVCRNDSRDGHSVVLALRGSASNRYGVGAVVRAQTGTGTQVRTLVLARGYLSTSEPVIHFGIGQDTEIKTLTVEWPSGRVQTLVNLAADFRYTVTEPTDAAPSGPRAQPVPQFTEISDAAHVGAPNRERPLDEWRQQPLLPFRMNRPGPPVVIANFDGDQENDIALGGVAGEAGQLFSNLGGGQFLGYGRSAFADTAAVADGPMLALDADGDGDLDLFVTKAGVSAEANANGYQARLLLNDGTGSFVPAPEGMVPAVRMSVGAAAAADFEHTGRLGVFLGGRVVPGRYGQVPRSVLLAPRDGRLLDVTEEMAPMLAQRGMVTAALWSDIDADGWPDLLVASDWGQVACFRNVEGKRFEDASERFGFAQTGNGWWRSLAAADLNGDNRPDYLAGNVGLNTPYRATAEEPTVLYAGVVLDGSAPQLVEAQAEQGIWYPTRNREALIQAFPSLARRFPDAESYARAPLDSIFPAETLNAASKLVATELRSGVFLSQRDGTYKFTPLPRLAQLAPIYGMAAGDFDGDGRADVLLVGNSFAPIAPIGRFDGGVGLLLRGDGRGTLVPAPVPESGVVVRRDAKALAVCDFNQDGWPDFLATRNNDRPLAFLNRPLPGRHSFGVALRGPLGNPDAIGARIVLKLGDGSTQTAEIAAGSGYFAQSSATVFFGFPDETRPSELRILWPDGRETVQTLTTAPAKILRISAP